MDSGEYLCDEWPTMADGSDFDGEQLLTLIRAGLSPFQEVWDVNLLIQEIENHFGATVVDIPVVTKGSNYFGFHVKLSNSMNIVARLARQDVNMPHFCGFPLERQVMDVKFEAAVYKLLRSEPGILVSHLLYHRIPVQHAGPRGNVPQDILGRRLFFFENAEGEKNVWPDFQDDQVCLLAQAARIRASLFNFNIPLDFAAEWFLGRLFEHKPESLPAPVTPTRAFWVAILISKIEATIRNIGDIIGWENDNTTVGPIAAAAKQSLLRLIPHIMPVDDEKSTLYRIVLDHDDYGIHNMTITTDPDGGCPLITSLYDWETGCIVPAILSDPLLSVWVDLVTDEDAAPAITRINDDATSEYHEECMSWSREYFKVLFDQAPDYERAIKAGKDVRHLWFALRDWRGEDPEGYVGRLGIWAENKMIELGVA